MTDEDVTDEVSLKIASLNDWRGERLRWVRRLIRQAVPEVDEAVKWRKASNPLGVPTWSYHGILCTGETYQDKVKLTFMNGVALPDPHGLFTDEATGTRRAIDMRQHEQPDERALAALVRAAARHNRDRAGRG